MTTETNEQRERAELIREYSKAMSEQAIRVWASKAAALLAADAQRVGRKPLSDDLPHFLKPQAS